MLKTRTISLQYLPRPVQVKWNCAAYESFTDRVAQSAGCPHFEELPADTYHHLVSPSSTGEVLVLKLFAGMSCEKYSCELSRHRCFHCASLVMHLAIARETVERGLTSITCSREATW
jgi:hypothetical protein